MIIGADVSHAAPGSSEASFAAITVSMDHICARYAAAVEANGFRAEMITTKNIEKMLTPLIENWKEHIGKGKVPDQVYYFRDGVSAGQYQAVLKFEVEAMKQLFAKLGREKTHKVSRSKVSKPHTNTKHVHSQSSRLSLRRRGIISDFSPNPEIETEIHCQVPWLRKM